MRAVVARLRDAFWVIPMVCAVTATALGLALAALDEALGTSLAVSFLFAGGPEGARALLTAIITSMISFTGLVFSITIVVLQLTSSQFSPRVLRTFLRDRLNQVALGVFVATFTYALVALRAVRGTADVDPFVPQITVTVAFGLVLCSVVVFLFYIDHIAQSIRVATIISTIATESRALLEVRMPMDGPTGEPPPMGHFVDITAGRAGVLQRLDEDALLRMAETSTATVRLLRAVGEFVPEGAAMVRWEGPALPDEERIRAAAHMGSERTPDQDLAFGFRQLVDIAERALSPGINDPTTAVQTVDHLHDLLRRLAVRPVPAFRRITGSGEGTVWVPQPTFEGYVALAVDEIAHWGRDSERVVRRLQLMLQDVIQVARPEHAAVARVALARHGWSDEPSGEQLEAGDTGLR